MRGPGLLVAILVLSLTFAARAQTVAGPVAAPLAVVPSAESTRAACTDGVDNDGDGHVDCADQDCQDFTFCAGVVGAHADDLAKLRGKGTARVVIGAVMLSLGLITAATSTPLWLAGAGGVSEDWYVGAGSMVGGGVLLIGGGTALLAVGAGNLAEARRPRLALDGNGVGVRF